MDKLLKLQQQRQLCVRQALLDEPAESQQERGSQQGVSQTDFGRAVVEVLATKYHPVEQNCQ